MIRSSATAIEVNGLHVILLLLVPILLTAITLLGLRLQQTTMRKILLWSPAVVLLGFCFVAIASIGMFYLPTALALLVAAIADLGGQEGNEPDLVSRSSLGPLATVASTSCGGCWNGEQL